PIPARYRVWTRGRAAPENGGNAQAVRIEFVAAPTTNPNLCLLRSWRSRRIVGCSGSAGWNRGSGRSTSGRRRAASQIGRSRRRWTTGLLGRGKITIHAVLGYFHDHELVRRADATNVELHRLVNVAVFLVDGLIVRNYRHVELVVLRVDAVKHD